MPVEKCHCNNVARFTGRWWSRCHI